MGNCWTEVTLFVENTKFVKGGFVLDIIFLCMNSKLVKKLFFSQILAILSGDDTYVWTKGVEWVIQLLNGLAMFVLYIDRELFFGWKIDQDRKFISGLLLCDIMGCATCRDAKCTKQAWVQMFKYTNTPIHKYINPKWANTQIWVTKLWTLDACRTDHGQAQTRSSKKCSTGDQTLILDL